MKKLATALFARAIVGMTIGVAPALAQQVTGGHDETSEVNAPLWATGAPTPGTAPALVAAHLLVTEVIVRRPRTSSLRSTIPPLLRSTLPTTT